MRKKVDSFRLELKRIKRHKRLQRVERVEKKKQYIRRINHYHISKPDREGVTGYTVGKSCAMRKPDEERVGGGVVVTDETFYFNY